MNEVLQAFIIGVLIGLSLGLSLAAILITSGAEND